MHRLWFISLVLGFFACTSEENPQPLGLEYYPLVDGFQRVYAYSETTYLEGTPTDTTFFIRETVIDSVDDSENYYLLSEASASGNGDWTRIRFDRLRRGDRFLEVTRENVPEVVLTFPVQAGRSWDANATNADTLQAERRFETLDPADVMFGTAPHIKVIIADLPENLVERDDRIEIYAEGIGLVQRTFIQYTFCLTDCSEAMQIDNGQAIDMSLIEVVE